MRIQFDDPKLVGQSEYHALHELLVDAEVIRRDGTVKDVDHALAMLSELEGGSRRSAIASW